MARVRAMYHLPPNDLSQAFRMVETVVGRSVGSLLRQYLVRGLADPYPITVSLGTYSVEVTAER
jgi:hypothetical protein